MSERVWQDDPIRFGAGGLDLAAAVDAIPPGRVARLKNLQQVVDGGLTPRPGQTAINPIAAGAIIHTLARLEDPGNDTFTRIVGVDAELRYGVSAFLVADTGYSGKPLAIVLYRPPQSGETWAIVGDENKMRKIRRDGLNLPLGRAAPTIAPTVVLVTEERTTIEACESGWTAFNGTGANGAVTNPVGKNGNCVQLTVTTTASPTPGFAGASKAVTLNMNQVGARAASDDDLIHLWLKVDRPDQLDEVRLYFVVSAFTAGVVPGTSATQNTDGYVKAFAPESMTTALEMVDNMPVASDRGDVRNRRDDALANDAVDDSRSSEEAREDRRRERTQKVAAARGQWKEYGIVGVPLRRGDFLRFGNDNNLSWTTVTGLVLTGKTKAGIAVVVSIDDIYFTGGYPLDTTEAETDPYTYYFTVYDPRTGDESNPSPPSAGIDSLRRGVVIDPIGTGDANLRQRFYRLGGAITAAAANGRPCFVGTNNLDGAPFTDTISDDQAVTAGEVDEDHDEPVTTTASDGSTVKAQPLPRIFGPVAGLYILGCGDPYRKGHLYWCKAGEPSHWPAAHNLELCSPSEELMNGVVYNGQPFVWTRERLLAGYVNQPGSDQTFTFQAAPVGHGLVAPWAFAVGPELYWVDRDGIYASNGGPERNLSASQLGPLFARTVTPRDLLPSVELGGYGEGGYGEGGYGTLGNQGISFPPRIDWTKEDKLRLAVYENELWFCYQDETGRIQTLVYNLLSHEWRWYLFGRAPLVLYREEYAPQSSRLLIGSSNGKVYEHAGFNDDGLSIDWLVRTGARSQGNERAEKLYGDLVVDCDPQETEVSIRTYRNREQTFFKATQIDGGIGRQRYLEDHFFGGVHANAMSVELVGISATGRAILYLAQLSFLIDPDRIATRASDWDDNGVPGPKLVKALLVQLDTEGAAKDLVIEADGQVITTVTVTTQTREERAIALPAFEATLLRVRPVGDGSCLIYRTIWVCDDLPLRLTRFETRALDFGILGMFVHFDGFITYNAPDTVTFSLTIDGVTTVYALGATAGDTRKQYIPFRANRGLLAEYLLESPTAFMLFKDQTGLQLLPWGAQQPQDVRPFGGADIDPPAREGL